MDTCVELIARECQVNPDSARSDPANVAGSPGQPNETRAGAGRKSRMSLTSRLLVAVAALLLSLTYFFPLWEISLDAPQYPEGLGMEIWINQMQGQNPGDLNKINNLNHYIGMKQIKPESIPELRIMPWIMRALMVVGLLAALLGRRWFLLIWLMLFLAVSVAGLVDFYLWGYDFGHNLDAENAIIKVPGMSYQPPLIGTKQLLNFKAISVPGIGGWATIGVFVLGALTWVYEQRRLRKRVELGPSSTVSVMAGAFFCFMAACSSPGPSEIRYGVDQCDYCKMSVVDRSFGTELVTVKGRVYKYDSIECLAAADLVMAHDKTQIHTRWVTDFSNPGTFLNVEHALIVATERQRSPMGVGLVAVSSRTRADELTGSVGGKIVNWPEVKSLVAETWKLVEKQ